MLGRGLERRDGVTKYKREGEDGGLASLIWAKKVKMEVGVEPADSFARTFVGARIARRGRGKGFPREFVRERIHARAVHGAGCLRGVPREHATVPRDHFICDCRWASPFTFLEHFLTPAPLEAPRPSRREQPSRCHTGQESPDRFSRDQTPGEFRLP